MPLGDLAKTGALLVGAVAVALSVIVGAAGCESCSSGTGVQLGWAWSASAYCSQGSRGAFLGVGRPLFVASACLIVIALLAGLGILIATSPDY